MAIYIRKHPSVSSGFLLFTQAGRLDHQSQLESLIPLSHLLEQPHQSAPTHTLLKMKRAAEDEYPTPARSTKKIRIRRRFVTKAVDLPPPSLKRKNPPNPILLPSKSRTMANIKAVHKPPKGLYNEGLFDLSSSRLINPLPVKYEWRPQKTTTTDDTTTTTSPGPEPDIEPRFWYPAPIKDDIKKMLFLHPSRRGVVWVGRFAEAKLKEEIKKYHRIKDLWLFQASDAYIPGYDEKAEFIATVYEEEMLSPWVVCWLSELIGEAEVGRILEHIEANLEKSLAEME